MMKLRTRLVTLALFLFWSIATKAAYPCPGGPGYGEVVVGEDKSLGTQLCVRDEVSDIQHTPSNRPMAHKDTHWGAIAIDKTKVLVNDKELKFIGVSSMKKTMKEAQKAALEMCKSDGSKDCELVESVPNQCLSISIAAKDNGIAYFFASTVQDAMTISQHKCNQTHKDCKVAYTACSYADF